MPTSRTDLLSVTRSLLRGGSWLCLSMIVLFTFVLIALFIGHPERMNIMTTATIAPEMRLFAVRVGVAGALIANLALLPMLRLLLRVVDSARSGDPFVPENGQRLRQIGWLLLVVNIAVDSTITLTLRGHIGLPPVSFTAVLTVLMVFVIARIFDTGSAMRAELQETV